MEFQSRKSLYFCYFCEWRLKTTKFNFKLNHTKQVRFWASFSSLRSVRPVSGDDQRCQSPTRTSTTGKNKNVSDLASSQSASRALRSSTFINKILPGNMYVNTYLLFHGRSGKVQKQPHANKIYCLYHLIHYRTFQWWPSHQAET